MAALGHHTAPTNKQIFKYMSYLNFALILVTILNVYSALKFRTYICLHQVVTQKMEAKIFYFQQILRQNVRRFLF